MAQKKNPFDEFEVEDLPPGEMHWRDGFDTRFIRYTNLHDKPKVVTITDVKGLLSKNKDETKRQLLVYLQEFEKPWAINVTNSESIGLLHGTDPRGWIGKQVELYPTKTRFGREVVDCIRVRDKVPERMTAKQATRHPDAAAAMVTQASAEPAKRQHSEKVKAYLTAMASITNTDALQTISDHLVEDNSLSASETALLVRALTRRTEQLQEAAT
jgi:uncharacterized protein with von Willebrand factor type A (vWA) domain